MADKLSGAEWTGFKKRHKLELDDEPFSKALVRFDKADESQPQAQLDALEEVVAQCQKLIVALARRRKQMGDKPFALAKDKLDDLLALAEALQPELRDSLDDAEADGSPALLSTKMLPLLRELRKGQSTMHAMVCTAGKNTAVLIMRRPVGTPRRKLLAEAVDAAGGAKYITAQCLLEEAALTFVVQSPAAGLAKRLRAALLTQTGLRLKVRVRGDDGVAEQDGEDDDAGVDAPPGSGGDAPAPPSGAQAAFSSLLRRLGPRITQASGPNAAAIGKRAAEAAALARQQDWARALEALTEVEVLLEAGDAAPRGEAPRVDPGSAFTARLGALMPQVKAALAASGPAAAEIRLKVSEAGALARQREPARAQALLDEVETLLGQAGGDADAAHEQALSLWRERRQAALAALKAVAARIAAARHPSSARAVVEISAVVKNLTAEPRSLQQVTELRRYLGEDEVVADVCELSQDIRTPLLGALERLQSVLAA